VVYGDLGKFGHDRDYAGYLRAININDAFIEGVWEYTQPDSFYKGQTLFIITAGPRPEAWHHEELLYHGKIPKAIFKVQV